MTRSITETLGRFKKAVSRCSGEVLRDGGIQRSGNRLSRHSTSSPVAVFRPTIEQEVDKPPLML